MLEELFLQIRSVRKHQLEISNYQTKTMTAAINVLSKLVDRQAKILEEISISSKVRQLQYEALKELILLLSQQQQKILKALLHNKNSL